MKKEYTIRIYKKKAGDRNESFVRDIFSGSVKKEAFKEGREELVRIANCDLDGGRSEASEDDILEQIKSIEGGNGNAILDILNRINNYCFDQTTYFFKVFSKKAK